MIDKHNIIPSLANRGFTILELGCGSRKRSPDWLGTDAIDSDDVDIVGDAHEVLDAIPSGTIDEVHAYHFAEHVEHFDKLLSQIAQVMRPNGQLRIVVPHFSNPYFYSDPTHKSFWGLYTFAYYAKTDIFQRKVPTYSQNPNFRLDQVHLGFKSSRPFYVRHAFKRIWGFIFNASVYIQEYYEENLTSFAPCYEVEYKLTRLP